MFLLLFLAGLHPPHFFLSPWSQKLWRKYQHPKTELQLLAHNSSYNQSCFAVRTGTGATNTDQRQFLSLLPPPAPSRTHRNSPLIHIVSSGHLWPIGPFFSRKVFSWPHIPSLLFLFTFSKYSLLLKNWPKPETFPTGAFLQGEWVKLEFLDPLLLNFWVRFQKEPFFLFSFRWKTLKNWFSAGKPAQDGWNSRRNTPLPLP